MPDYRIEAEGDAREVYDVVAESKDDARAKFERGELGPADLTEVNGSEIKSIEEMEPA